ncbi:hypothetical protein [Nonomuraea basaltis]|uniref:hypothetical protein n=1 Tax=Nonomuraea basaltis TaxID=2495887 RepID=UPI00110C48FF|nr:hypothetical protein [Nonomuraea basaltis]TMR99539.1 hypothetical protein EJK15_06920 [Nonomuraea basaltis]
MNALKISEQQRQDALTQRSEDQKKEAQAKAAAEALEKQGFANRIVIASSEFSSSSSEERWRVRNSNSRRAYVYIRLSPDEQPPELYEFIIEPCSEADMAIPLSDTKFDDYGGYKQFIVTPVPADARTGADFWLVSLEGLSPQHTTLEWATGWTSYELEQVRRDISPCI